MNTFEQCLYDIRDAQASKLQEYHQSNVFGTCKDCIIELENLNNLAKEKIVKKLQLDYSLDKKTAKMAYDARHKHAFLYSDSVGDIISAYHYAEEFAYFASILINDILDEGGV